MSWGAPQHRPVLLVHGYMDSAATFIPIVELLPDDYFYLAVDLPGMYLYSIESKINWFAAKNTVN